MNKTSLAFRVLLVEDEPGDAGLIRRALRDERFGRFETTWATTMAEAGEKLAEEEYDVALLDLSLPDSTGLDTVQAGIAAAGSVPIVVLTGRDDAEFALEVLDQGAQDYLVKGAFDDDGLIRALRHALARSLAEQALRESRGLLQAITDSAKDAIFLVDAEGRISFWNPAAALVFGFSEEEALGRRLEELIAPPQYATMYQQAFSEFQHLGPGAARGQTMEVPARRKDRQEVIVELSLSAFRNKQGWYAVGVLRDITERKRAEHDLRLTRFSVENSPDSVFWVSEDARIEYVNQAACRTLGYARDELCAMTVHDIDPDYTPDLWPAHWETLRKEGRMLIETRQRTKDGHMIPVEMSLNYFQFEGRAYNVAQARDITERKAAEEKLVMLAVTDPLTNLYNRRSFMEAVEQEMGRFRRYGKAPSLMMLDLDHFKRINDTYGHAGGDEALRCFARTLRQTLRETDLPGRLGGEEFAVLLPETGQDSALAIAQRILHEVRSARIPVDDQTVAMTVSIGLSVMQENDSSVDALLARADAALYRAKKSGRDRVETG